MTRLERLTALKTNIETNLPLLISGAGLVSIDEFILGAPSQEDIKSIGFYAGPGVFSVETETFSPVIQMQLHGVQYETALKYFDLLNEYLRALLPEVVGMQELSRIDDTEFPPDNNTTTFYFYYLEYESSYDDCDY